MNAAAKAAVDALPSWGRTSALDGIKYLFKLRELLKSNLAQITRTITKECGMTFEEAKAEMARY
ncbi:MAG: aldehyde dehydrogenase family protein [Chloroflexi bacterium]|nr:MAG: aldehyde dehydrogenase family protein [Chloroflexota bacterium]